MNLILSAAQHKEADRNAGEIGIPSLVLMERAALAVTEEILRRYPDPGRVLVVCGTGNNAGDGVAVARQLCERGIRPVVVLIGKREKFSAQLQDQLRILDNYPVRIEKMFADEPGQLKDFHPETFQTIVDAIFGIGLHREVTGLYAEAINRMNEAGRTGSRIVSIDMPSGVHTNSGLVLGTAVHADLTVTFTTGKSGLYLFPGAACAGEVAVRKIGIPVSEDMAAACRLFSVGEEDLDRLPARDESGNKGTFKKLLVIAGSANICGAAFLSAKAALMSGVGMVKIYTEESNRTPLASLFPEALLSVYPEKGWTPEGLRKDMEWADAFLVGPGIGTGETALKILKTFLGENQGKPTVFDADALNLFAQHRDLLSMPAFPYVATPHLGEMSRLTDIRIPDIKREIITVARDAAAETGQIIVLKDARTVTALPDGRCFLNLSGNSALATAGSGDVLAGIMAAFFALYGDSDTGVPFAALAVFIHGRCGEKAAEKYSEASVTAGSLLEFLPMYV